MIDGSSLTSKFALDVQGVDQLKLAAKSSSPEALHEAAKQFEAVFMGMLIKSMREATPQDGMFDSEQTKMYTSMLDQQLTQSLASKGIGLADVMVRQLSGKGSDAAKGLSAPGFSLSPQGSFPIKAYEEAVRKLEAQASGKEAGLAKGKTQKAEAPAAASKREVPYHVGEFSRRMLPSAQAASAATGIPAEFIVGQAALESGWGKSEIKGPDGKSSHNLFGIKAGAGWKGKTVEALTTEYVDGKAQKQIASFRAYDSYEEAFTDYANLLKGNARYQSVIDAGADSAGFARGLQKAGYATDPNYASKLQGVIRKIG